MTRSRISWVLAIPLMVAGMLSAHWLSAALIAHPEARGELAEHAHGGLLSGAPMWAGAFVTIAIVAGGARLLMGSVRHVGPWAFMLLPPVAYIVTEIFERGLGTESFPFAPASEPRLLLGLALQVPFALAAYLTARLLRRVAHRIAGVMGTPVQARRPGRPLCVRFDDRVLVAPRQSAMALGYGERGPPGIAPVR